MTRLLRLTPERFEALQQKNMHGYGKVTETPQKAAKQAAGPSKRVAKPAKTHIFPGLPPAVMEYRFAAPRKWAFDYAWVDEMVALEVEGGAWTQGRHTRGAGFLKDMEKYNEAAIRGWKVIRGTPQQVKSGTIFPTLERALLPSKEF